ncbi:MAG: IS200/IS605 family transposase [Myxococcales bacterium]|nr:MAG: IS200/IS605 family transposase [Myxococcales bacterium]
MRSPRLRVYVHLVWATHERRPLLTSTLEPLVHESLRQRCGFGGTTLLALGGVEDHVHLLIALPATLSLAQLVGDLKGWSSYQANHQTERPLPFRWQGAYAALSVSERGVEPVIRYIARQREHHRHHPGGPWELDA